MNFVYVKVPGQSVPSETWDALHDALHQALEEAGTGSVVSWGTSLHSVGAAENDPRGFHRIDIELHDLEAGLHVLRHVLSSRNVSCGTELHFTVQGSALQQSLLETGWSDEAVSTGTPRYRFSSGA